MRKPGIKLLIKFIWILFTIITNIFKETGTVFIALQTNYNSYISLENLISEIVIRASLFLISNLYLKKM